MSALKRVNPRLRKGLSEHAVRLLLKEPAPKRPVLTVKKRIEVPEDVLLQATQSQLRRRLQGAKKSRRRG